MNLNFNTTVELKPKDVEKIIKDALAAACPGFNIGVVAFDVSKEARGYGVGEYDELVFRGAKVSLTPKTPHAHDGRGPG